MFQNSLGFHRLTGSKVLGITGALIGVDFIYLNLAGFKYCCVGFCLLFNMTTEIYMQKWLGLMF